MIADRDDPYAAPPGDADEDVDIMPFQPLAHPFQIEPEHRPEERVNMGIEGGELWRHGREYSRIRKGEERFSGSVDGIGKSWGTEGFGLKAGGLSSAGVASGF